MAEIWQFRRGFALSWTTQNPILADGEIGLERDTQKFKVGNGVAPWNSLEYYLTGPKGDTGPEGPPGTNGFGSTVYNEFPTGVRDGINKVFTTLYTFKTKSTRLYKNMLRLTIGEDYAETSANEITLYCIFRQGDTLVVDYDIETQQA